MWGLETSGECLKATRLDELTKEVSTDREAAPHPHTKCG